MKNKKIFSLGLLLFLILSLGVGLKLALSPQEIRKKAAGDASFLEVLKKRRSILLVKLEIDKVNSTVKVISLKKGLGFVPDYRNTTVLDYVAVKLTVDEGKEQSFLVPLPAEEVYAPPRNPKDILNYPKRKLDKYEISVILPYEPESKIEIKKDFENEKIRKEQKIDFQVPVETRTKAMLTSGNTKEEMAISDLPLSGLSGANDFQVKTIYDGNPVETDPAKTLDIVFVASGFNNSKMQTFDDFNNRQAGALFGFNGFSGKEPFNNNKKIVKIRSVFTERDFSNSGISEVTEFLSSIGIPFDQLAVVINKDGRSNASLGGGYCNLYISWNGPERELLFAHEFAHSFGAVLDEYIEYTGQSGDLYYKNKNCKEDPIINWLDNTKGGAYLGCYYAWNIYRPEEVSLMSIISNEIGFNEPTKAILEEALSAYRDNQLLVFLPSDIFSYKWVGNNGSYQSSIYLLNMGNNAVFYRARLDPAVSWITDLVDASGEMPAREINSPWTVYKNIYFNIDQSKVTSFGKYKTKMIIDFTDSLENTKTKTVEITLISGDDNSRYNLNWVSPQEGSIFEGGKDNVPININWQNIEPGWKRIEYYFQSPYAQIYSGTDIFSSRTIAPYIAVFKTIADPNNPPIVFGSYLMWAKGFPWMGNPVETQKVKIEIKAKAGTKCADWNSMGFSCKEVSNSPRCFRGADDCANQNLDYCCPSEITPTPTPSQTTLSRVEIEPPAIKANILDKPIGLSVLAYDINNQPINSEVTYEWGISSDKGIGTINPIIGNITNFNILNSGNGNIFVTAEYKGKIVTKGIPVTVSALKVKKGANKILLPTYLLNNLPFGCDSYSYKNYHNFWQGNEVLQGAGGGYLSVYLGCR